MRRANPIHTLCAALGQCVYICNAVATSETHLTALRLSMNSRGNYNAPADVALLLSARDSPALTKALALSYNSFCTHIALKVYVYFSQVFIIFVFSKHLMTMTFNEEREKKERFEKSCEEDHAGGVYNSLLNLEQVCSYVGLTARMQATL